MKQDISSLFHIKEGPSVKAKFRLTPEGIRYVSLAANPRNGLAWQIFGDGTNTEAVELIHDWMHAYASRDEPRIELPLIMGSLPPFTLKTLKTLQAVPFGVSVSYQALADRAGNSKAARAVGNACGRNPFPLIIPCHRVLAADGRIGGFSLDLEVKRRLLAFENILLA